MPESGNLFDDRSTRMIAEVVRREMARYRNPIPDQRSRWQRFGPSTGFIAQAPSPGGIPARSGTTPGSASCTLFSITSGPTLTSTSGTRTVYNLSTTAIDANEYVPVVRDYKSHKWVTRSEAYTPEQRFLFLSQSDGISASSVQPIQYVVSIRTPSPALGLSWDSGNDRLVAQEDGDWLFFLTLRIDTTDNTSYTPGDYIIGEYKLEHFNSGGVSQGKFGRATASFELNQTGFEMLQGGSDIQTRSLSTDEYIEGLLAFQGNISATTLDGWLVRLVVAKITF